MKNWTKTFGIIAIVAMIIFSMAGCDDNPGGNRDPVDVFSVSGKFDKGEVDGGGEVSFSLTATSAGRSAADAHAISGVLEDGDLTIRLSGTFDPVTLSYTASAAASIMRYTINGAMDDNGNSLGSTATLMVRDGNDWQAFTFVITETAVNISGNAVESETGGIPAFGRGNWFFSEDYDGDIFEVRLMINQWNMVADVSFTDEEGTAHDSVTASIVEVTGSGTTYDVVFGFPVYIGTPTQEATAVINFFTNQGVAITRIMSLEDPPPAGLAFYVQGDGWGIHWFNLTAAHDRLIDQFYRTNALEKYLISQNVLPITVFQKERFIFSDNNTKLTWLGFYVLEDDGFGTWQNFEFETAEDAKKATNIDDEQPITLTRTR
jgi:hypothetical protein